MFAQRTVYRWPRLVIMIDRAVWGWSLAILIFSLVAVAGEVLVRRQLEVPEHLRALSEIERAWVDYGGTRELIFYRDGSSRKIEPALQAASRNAWQRLVDTGELVFIDFDWQNQKVTQALYEKMSALRIPDCRFGLGLVGGQWGVGSVTVPRNFVGILRKTIDDAAASSLPPTLSTPGIKPE